MGGDHEPWPLDEAGVDCIAQVDGRELGVHAAQVTQGGEAEAHVLASQAEAFERFSCGGVKCLRDKVGGVHRQVDVRIDEPGGDRALGEIDHL